MMGPRSRANILAALNGSGSELFPETIVLQTIDVIEPCDPISHISNPPSIEGKPPFKGKPPVKIGRNRGKDYLRPGSNPRKKVTV